MIPLFKKQRIGSVEEYGTENSAKDMLPMHKRGGSYSPSLSQQVVSFRSLETSATIIEVFSFHSLDLY